MRPVHFNYDPDLNCLFASTNRGTILRLDLDLNVVASSDPVYGLYSLYVSKVDSQYIYAREITGKLVRWHKRGLKLDRLVNLTAWSDPRQANVPNVSHGLFLLGDFVYVSLPDGPVGKFRRTDLAFEKLSSYLPNSLIESVAPDVIGHGHFAVDFGGYLYRGRLDGDLKTVARVAHGACHQIIFDEKFRRYWVTDDFHCGLALIQPDSPSNPRRLYLTRDDVDG
ncbi:MAG: hypothetical protein HC902_00100 [Calothrix sp. SM1_5_4]|nr:hypothetical protein [Calothrix sp. SM1_5_4]